MMSDGTIAVGDAVIRREQLAGELGRLRAAAGDRPITVRADKHLSYGDVIEVLDSCRAAGFEQIGLVSVKRVK